MTNSMIEESLKVLVKDDLAKVTEELTQVKQEMNQLPAWSIEFKAKLMKYMELVKLLDSVQQRGTLHG